MAKTSLVLTVLGDDRPGLVESLARVVADHGANWLESRMAHLAGKFAGILRVEVDADQADTLTAALRAASAGDGPGLEMLVHPDATPTAGDPPRLTLDVIGHDRPGIVREISRVLTAAGVNVEELSTETRVAPHTGLPLFHATARLRLPPGADEQSLRGSLEAVAGDLSVEATLAAETTND